MQKFNLVRKDLQGHEIQNFLLSLHALHYPNRAVLLLQPRHAAYYFLMYILISVEKTHTSECGSTAISFKILLI